MLPASQTPAAAESWQQQTYIRADISTTLRSPCPPPSQSALWHQSLQGKGPNNHFFLSLSPLLLLLYNIYYFISTLLFHHTNSCLQCGKQMTETNLLVHFCKQKKNLTNKKKSAPPKQEREAWSSYESIKHCCWVSIWFLSGQIKMGLNCRPVLLFSFLSTHTNGPKRVESNSGMPKQCRQVATAEESTAKESQSWRVKRKVEMI